MSEADSDTDPPASGREPEKRMSFIEHLLELRSRLIKCIYALLLTTILTLVFYKPVFAFLMAPIDRANQVFRTDPGFRETMKENHVLPPLAGGGEVTVLEGSAAAERWGVKPYGDPPGAKGTVRIAAAAEGGKNVIEMNFDFTAGGTVLAAECGNLPPPNTGSFVFRVRPSARCALALRLADQDGRVFRSNVVPLLEGEPQAVTFPLQGPWAEKPAGDEPVQPREPLQGWSLLIRRAPDGPPAGTLAVFEARAVSASRELDLIRPITTDPLGLMFILMKVALYAGLVLGSPIILYEIWAFVSPGLKPNEIRAIRPVLMGGVGFFVVGAAFCYYLVFPYTLQFLVWFDINLGFQPSYVPQEYINLLITFMLIFGALFELPLVAAVLARLGLLKPEWLTHYWRFIILVCFILGAICSPGQDPISMLIMSGCLVFLYALSVAMAWFFYRRRKSAEAG